MRGKGGGEEQRLSVRTSSSLLCSNIKPSRYARRSIQSYYATEARYWRVLTW